MTDKTIAKLWDNNDTVKRNFQKLGLASDPNQAARSDEPTDAVKGPCEFFVFALMSVEED